MGGQGAKPPWPGWRPPAFGRYGIRGRLPVGRRAWPVRTCVGCRRRAPVFQLLRVVAAGSGKERQLLPDPARRLSGRGAHLHPDPACLALAERRRAFGRALRLTGVFDTGPLAEHLRVASAPRGTTDGGG